MSFWKIILLKSKINYGVCLEGLAWRRTVVDIRITDGNA